jgi:hypothetical protein
MAKIRCFMCGDILFGNPNCIQGGSKKFYILRVKGINEGTPQRGGAYIKWNGPFTTKVALIAVDYILLFCVEMLSDIDNKS